MCGASSVVGLGWTVATNPTSTLTYTIFQTSRQNEISITALKATFSEQNSGNIANITSQLMLTDISANNTNASCEAFATSGNREINFTVCVVGETL